MQVVLETVHVTGVRVSGPLLEQEYGGGEGGGGRMQNSKKQGASEGTG